jgi:copper homeostasis protein CutC
MKRDIHMASQLGVAGVVIGALLPDGTIDEDSTRQLLEIAKEEVGTLPRMQICSYG